jgi:alkanesulfonate monooxygenase SsuD/methylene tetrahydromethanopterin reductase-like flavin-dependent oxidoreductase (luciferase family)
MVTGSADDRTWSVHPWVASGQGDVRFGIMVQPSADGERLRELAQRIEALRYDAIWTYDHPLSLGAADCWITLALVATATSTIRVGSAVSCIPYRHPALLARMAADVDQLSDGRLVLGIGAGDDDAEFAQLGLPFPRLRERQTALEEALDVVCGLWSGEPFTYQGSHYQLREARLQALPVQRPRVPVLIAGGGERVTLRQVARRADMSNFGPDPWTGSARNIGDVVRKHDALRAHCEAAGRSFDSVSRSWFEGLLLADTTAEAEARREREGLVNESMRAFGPADAARHYRKLADAGIQHFIVWITPGDEETLRRLAQEVIPEVRRSSAPTTGAQSSS